MCSTSGSGMQSKQQQQPLSLAAEPAPPPQPRRVLLLNTAATPAPVAAACLVKPCKTPLDGDLARLLASGRLEASCVWCVRLSVRSANRLRSQPHNDAVVIAPQS
jgi:hypothetical protein